MLNFSNFHLFPLVLLICIIIIIINISIQLPPITNEVLKMTPQPLQFGDRRSAFVAFIISLNVLWLDLYCSLKFLLHAVIKSNELLAFVLNLSLVNEHFWILWLLTTAAYFEGFACSKRKALQALHKDRLFQQIKKKLQKIVRTTFILLHSLCMFFKCLSFAKFIIFMGKIPIPFKSV